jgi:hypothetical protein
MLMSVIDPKNPEQERTFADAASLREVVDGSNFQTRLDERLGAGSPVTLELESIPGTRLMRLHAVAGDPKRAADAANYASEELMAIARAVSQNEAAAMHEVIDRQLVTSRQRLKELGETLRAFPQVEILRSEKTIVSGERPGDRTVAQKTDRGDRLVDLLVELEGEKARLAMAQQQLSRRPRAAAASGRDGSDAAALVQQSARSAAPRAGDPPVLFDNATHPVYTVLEYQVTTARNRIAQLERERDALVRLLNLNGPDVAQLRQLYSKRMELARLETEYDLAQRTYMEVATRGEQTRIEAAARGTGLQLIEPARSPQRPTARNLFVTVVLALIVSTVLASAGALGYDAIYRARRANAEI